MSYWAHKSRAYQRGYPRGDAPPKVNDTPTAPPPPLGPVIETLRKDDMNEAALKLTQSAKIEHCRTVTSYNWLDKTAPEVAILVPGKPPLWTPLLNTTQLQEDCGKYFRDRNAARFPKHPLEPAVVTCLSEDPQLPAEVDIVACGSTLGNLLQFVRGHDKPFRIPVQKVHNTVFFIRRENSPTELIPGVRGYGHAFPEAYTTWEPAVKGSGSHQRVLHYSFGGLKLLVRSEVDGYLNSTLVSNQRTKGGMPRAKLEQAMPPLLTPRANNATLSMNELTGLLSDNNITPQTPTPSTKLQIITGGSVTDQRLVFDLKTRSIKTQDKDHLGEELPRLWAKQIQKFILAFHVRGSFKESDIHIRDVRDEVLKWERDNNRDLARLAALIHQIINMVSSEPDRKFELCYSTIGKLDVRKQLPDAGDVLSPEAREKWEHASQGQCFAGHNNEADDKEGFRWDEDGGQDFTACSSDTCGYCGKCTY